MILGAIWAIVATGQIDTVFAVAEKILLSEKKNPWSKTQNFSFGILSKFPVFTIIVFQVQDIKETEKYRIRVFWTFRELLAHLKETSM